MEHNTNRILWMVLVLAIGIALYVSLRPAANGLLKQGISKIQTVTTNVHGDTKDSSGLSSNTTVGANLAHQTNSDWQKASFQNDWGITYLCDPIYEIVDGETYTAQVEVQNATSPVMLELFAIDANGNRDFTINANGNFNYDGVLAPRQSTDKDGKISITFTAHLPKGYAYLRPDLAFTNPLTSPGSYEYRRFKIEKGSEATPWVP